MLTTETSQWCVFRLGSRYFAVAVKLLREVVEVPSLTSVPLAPPELLGLFSLRGQVVPLLDLQNLILKQPSPPTPLAALVEWENQRAGLTLDEVLGLVNFPELPDETTTSPLLKGALVFEGKPAQILDVPAILTRLSEQLKPAARV
jgi:purine-binding chemotaxis protein CheW